MVKEEQSSLFSKGWQKQAQGKVSGEETCPETVYVRPSERVPVFPLRAEMPWKAGRRKTELKSDP